MTNYTSRNAIEIERDTLRILVEVIEGIIDDGGFWRLAKIEDAIAEYYEVYPHPKRKQDDSEGETDATE